MGNVEAAAQPNKKGAPSQARIMKLVAIPAEHGGWSFLFEPVLLGLILAPSFAGLWLSVAGLGIFLLRHPFELVVGDRRKGRRYPRTVWAERFSLFYAAMALVGLVLAILTAQHPFWLPVVLAAPLALVQIYLDLLRQSRALLAELAGAVAIGAAGAAIAMAGGWAAGPALALWAIVAVRAVTTIIYVRGRLRLERGEQVNLMPAWVSHFVGLLLAIALAALGVAPWLAVVVVALLTARAAWGLSPYRRSVRAQVIGMTELAVGIATVLLVAAGYLYHL